MAKLEYRLYTDWQDTQILDSLKKSASKEIALDVETTGLDPFKDQLRLIQVYFPHSNEVAILDVWEMNEPKRQWLHRLFDVLEDSSIVKYLQNSLFDLLWFRCVYGLQIRNVRDVKVLSQLDKAGQYEAYLYYAGISTPNSLEWLSQEFGYEHDKSDQKSDWSGKLTMSQLNYAARDVVVTYHIGRRLYESLSTYQPDVVDAEMRCLAAFNELNFQGLPVGDQTILDKVCALYRKAADSARESLSRLMDEDPVQKKKIDAYYKKPLIGKSGKPIKVPKARQFNVDSAAQVKEYLIATFGKDAIEKYDTSSGRYKESTGKDVLFDLYNAHPEAKLKELLYYRSVAKAASTLESYRNSYDPDRKCLRVIYQSLATQGMGRSSSGDKRRKDLQNAQNIAKHLPSHQHYHLPPIRSIISARPGYVLLEIDLAASHLQFARILSKDPSMQAAKESGIKLHYYTLSSMLKLDGLTVTPEECIDLVKGRADKSRKEYYEYLYKCSKTVIYSFLNYAGAKRLQQSFRSYETNVSLEDCQKFLEACAKQYWKLREFQDTVYRRACSTIQSVYVYNRLTGEQIYLGKLGYSITCDGAKVWHRAEQYDRYDKLKISDVVSAQWLRPEATVMKNALATIHDRCIEEWGTDNARLVNFSHDSLMMEIREELISEIAPKICDIVNDCMRVYIPDYEPEETWEEQILKHNWAKYDCQQLKIAV